MLQAFFVLRRISEELCPRPRLAPKNKRRSSRGVASRCSPIVAFGLEIKTYIHTHIHTYTHTRIYILCIHPYPYIQTQHQDADVGDWDTNASSQSAIFWKFKKMAIFLNFQKMAGWLIADFHETQTTTVQGLLDYSLCLKPARPFVIWRARIGIHTWNQEHATTPITTPSTLTTHTHVHTKHTHIMFPSFGTCDI